MEQKFRELQNKVNALAQSDQHPDHSHKLKIRTLTQCLHKLQARMEEENIVQEHKLGSMIDHVRKLEQTLKDTQNTLEL
jgi:hypothetical protein